jgi:putative redox protein
MAYDATVTWKDGIHFEAESAGQVVHMDGIPEAGGQGLGASPMRLVLMALGGCTGMDVISLLKKMRQDVTGLEIVVSGERATEHPKVYTSLDILFRVRGRSVQREMVERAVSLSEEKYCSVGGMLKKAATLTTRIEIVEETT